MIELRAAALFGLGFAAASAIVLIGIGTLAIAAGRIAAAQIDPRN